MKEVFSFHNKIKKKYIDKYAGSNLLDLASGKGGDLYKWVSNSKIKNVTGYDFNKDSVDEAKKRLSKIKNLRNKKINFFVKDLSKEILPPNDVIPDIITINFAFHYFFKDSLSLKNILQSISNNSKPGTKLLLTLFDGDLIKTDIVYPRFFIKKLDSSNKSQYNNKILVHIQKSVLDKPEVEYIVKSKFLIKKLKEKKFELVENIPFEELYKEMEFRLNEEEKSLSFLNKVYIFVKTK